MSQRRVVVGIAGAVATMLLAACGFDSPAVTNHEKASIQARDFSVGKIRVRDTYVTTVQDNSRGFSASPATTYVVLSLVNQGTQSDALTGITSPAGSVALTGSGVFGGSLTVPPKGVPVVVDLPVLSPQGPTATFTTASTTTPQLGTYVPMQFTFSGAGTSGTEPVPVIPPTQTTAATSPIPTNQATPPPVPGENASD